MPVAPKPFSRHQHGMLSSTSCRAGDVNAALLHCTTSSLAWASGRLHCRHHLSQGLLSCCAGLLCIFLQACVPGMLPRCVCGCHLQEFTSKSQGGSMLCIHTVTAMRCIVHSYKSKDGGKGGCRHFSCLTAVSAESLSCCSVSHTLKISARL